MFIVLNVISLSGPSVKTVPLLSENFIFEAILETASSYFKLLSKSSLLKKLYFLIKSIKKDFSLILSTNN